MRNRSSKRLLSVVCAFVLLLALAPAARAADSPAKSTNINKQDYATYGTTVRSYLYANASGGLTRVEYTGSSVVVEDYDSSYDLVNSRTISMELPIWGGFYAGSSANYLIFGQKNTNESDSTEVIRVVKYSKDWTRQGQASLKGANTVTPFDAGSLRCDEYGGYLYIRTCHTMYTTSDRLNHQANMTFSIKESDMTITDAFYDIWNEDYGYVSHSFNQFLIVDQDGKIVTLDHGDANTTRGVVWMGYFSNASTGKFTGKQYGIWCYTGIIQSFAGSGNATGASIGGLAETNSSYIMAFNYDGKGGSGSRDVYLNAANKASGKSMLYKLANGGDNTTPVLAPVDMDGGYIMWNGKSSGKATDTLYYTAYLDDGRVGPVLEAKGSLSDCQPIPYDGKVVWYVTNNSEPTFYGLDAAGVHILGGASPSTATTPSTSTTPSANTTPNSNTTPSNNTTPNTNTTPSNNTTPNTNTTPSTNTTPNTNTTPSNNTTPSTNTTPSNTLGIQELDPRNIDPNSPRIGEVIGGSASCDHVHNNSDLWYWSGTPGTTSCTENSYSYYTCSICGAKIVNGIMYAPGHQFKDGVCTICGISESGEEPSGTTGSTSDTMTPDTTATDTTTPDTTAPGAAATPAAPSANQKNPFTDVPSYAYFADAVLWALDNGITTGTTATTFEPYTTCTRGQVVTFLWRAMGCPEPAIKTNPFRDVKSTSPYFKAILWAYETGITTGTSATEFSPNGTCTNGHVVTFLWRAEGEPAATGTSSLATPGKYYTDAVAWADTCGLLANTGSVFNPASQSPRANIVTYLYRNLAE